MLGKAIDVMVSSTCFAQLRVLSAQTFTPLIYWRGNMFMLQALGILYHRPVSSHFRLRNGPDIVRLSGQNG
jgi:hypothetical protein